MIRRNTWFYLMLFNLLVMAFTVGHCRNNLDSTISFAIFSAITIFPVCMFFRTWLRTRRRTRLKDEKIATSSDLVWKKLKQSKTAIVGLVVILIITYAAILAPFVAPADPLEIDWMAVSAPPSSAHWLGCDDMGRDILSRVIYGARVALGIGMLAVILNTIIGTTLGIVAGYFGGKVDFLVMRALEFWSSLPFILFAIALMAALGTSIVNLTMVVSLTGIMEFARIIRSEALQLRSLDYISAARVLGLPDLLILLRHVLPNCLAPVIIMATLRIGDIILTVAGLSFLGLGIMAPTPSLGSMLASGQQFLYENPAMSLAPGTTILLIVLAVNLLGDGLRDALDSKLND